MTSDISQHIVSVAITRRSDEVRGGWAAPEDFGKVGRDMMTYAA
jgi:hypothetical protein